MARGMRMVMQLRPSYTAAEEDRMGTLTRQSDSTNGARPKNGMHSRRKYGLLAPEEPEGVEPKRALGKGRRPQGH